MNFFKSYHKLLTLSLAMIIASSLFSQVTGRKYPDMGDENLSPHGKIAAKWYNLEWFLEGNLGTRVLGSTSSNVNLSPGFNVNLSLGYMFSDRFGIKGRYDFNSFKFTPGFNGKSGSIGRMHSISLEAVTDLIPLFNGTEFRNWRLQLHGGAGLSTYGNVDYREFREEEIKPWEDPAIKGNDDMGHVILGITPQYHINSRWSVNLDLSSFILIKQSNTFDRFSDERFDGLGNVTTISLGLTFRP